MGAGSDCKTMQKGKVGHDVVVLEKENCGSEVENL